MPKYLNNKENFLKTVELIKKRQQIINKYFKDYDPIFLNITCCNKELDTRDFINMSYALCINNPQMEDSLFEEEVKKLKDAFTPKFTKEELEAKRKKFNELNEAKYKSDLEHIEENKNKALEYEASKLTKPHSFFKQKLKDLQDLANKDLIEERYKKAQEILNKEEFSELDLYKLNEEYGLGKDYIENLKKDNFIKISNKALPYVLDLKKFRQDMVENINSLNPDSLSDTYKMVSFALLCQTNSVKGKEFKVQLDNQLKSIENFKKDEELNVKAEVIQNEIGSDFVEYNFNANDVSSLTLGNALVARENNERQIRVNRSIDKVNKTYFEGKIEFELQKEDYDLSKKLNKYLKNVYDFKQADNLRKMVSRGFGTIAENLANRTLSDIHTRDKLHQSWPDTTFIDGKPLTEIEPLKGFLASGNEEIGRYHLTIASAILLKSMIEGKHRITTTRYSYFKGELNTEIIPIHVNHDKDAYLASKNRFYRFFHKYMNVQKHFDKMFDKSSKNSVKYDNLSNTFLDKYKTILLDNKSLKEEKANYERIEKALIENAKNQVEIDLNESYIDLDDPNVSRIIDPKDLIFDDEVTEINK